MLVGYVGSGNMARAMATGWAQPFLCSDSGSGSAARMAGDLGGEAVATTELVERADLVVLAHKPYQLDEVASALGDARPEMLLSVLAGTTVERVRAAHRGAPALRVEPSTLTAVRRGAMVMAPPDADLDAGAVRSVTDHLSVLGEIVVVPERVFGAGGAMCGVGPAYWALLVEALVDSGVRRGLTVAQAQTLVTATMGGTAELLRARDHDTLAVRRAVASPGGGTARGLAALEAHGVRAAMSAATDAVVG